MNKGRDCIAVHKLGRDICTQKSATRLIIRIDFDIVLNHETIHESPMAGGVALLAQNRSQKKLQSNSELSYTIATMNNDLHPLILFLCSS